MTWNTILSISGIFLTIFFGILSYILYRKGIKKKKLFFDVKSINLISENLSNYNGLNGLEISYNNEKIETLTSSIVTIINSGNDIIEVSDITPSEPILITASNKFLLNNSSEYAIFTTNNKATVSLKKINDAKLQLMFDFLRPKDIIKVTLLHTGNVIIKGDLKCGTIDNNLSEESLSSKDEDEKDTEALLVPEIKELITVVIFLATLLLMVFFILDQSSHYETIIPIVLLELLLMVRKS